MPLLPKEADLFPDEFFALPEGPFPWHVAHVRSRQEKLMARRLMEQQIPFYLPQVERVSERSSRRFRSYVPLFAGYVFFRGGRSRLRRRAAKRRHRTNRSTSTIRRLLGAQLKQIRDLQLAGASFDVYEELLPDDVVTITEGPFRGYRGAVVRSGRARSPGGRRCRCCGKTSPSNSNGRYCGGRNDKLPPRCVPEALDG